MSIRSAFVNVMVMGTAFALVGCGAPTVQSTGSGGSVVGGSGGRIGSGGIATGSGGHAAGGSGGLATGSGGLATGGTSGGSGGGAPCVIAAADPDLISDMEETNPNSFFKNGCMVGSWYTTKDPSAGATIVPAASAAFTYDSVDCHAGKCAKVTATGFAKNTAGSYTNWGWQMGLGLNSPSKTAAFPVNASTKSGITFWAKASAASDVLVALSTPCTTPTGRPGGKCVAAASAQCDVTFDKVVKLTDTWAQYTVAWADLIQPTSWSTYAKCTDKQSAILNINFKHDNSASASATAPVLDGSFSIDDLAFTP